MPCALVERRELSDTERDPKYLIFGGSDVYALAVFVLHPIAQHVVVDATVLD